MTLTIISILLAVIAVITGFFGMNVPLPFANVANAWFFIIVLNLFLWLFIAAMLRFIISRK
ncbi:hypothetical protein HHO37_05385 [Streptococcus ursoris]|uniref:Uncharacterized protein n=1 Tax=Streptococcus ratti TaxID=1341 RepID=A0A7X9LDT9_STRRT|nr:hypothetical protein [Streptococcus ratti]